MPDLKRLFCLLVQDHAFIVFPVPFRHPFHAEPINKKYLDPSVLEVKKGRMEVRIERRTESLWRVFYVPGIVMFN